MDLRALQKLQRDTGFNPVFLEKAYHITRILAGISQNAILADALALKGGTALNFVYLDVPRLSIDLIIFKSIICCGPPPKLYLSYVGKDKGSDGG